MKPLKRRILSSAAAVSIFLWSMTAMIPADTIPGEILPAITMPDISIPAAAEEMPKNWNADMTHTEYLDELGKYFTYTSETEQKTGIVKVTITGRIGGYTEIYIPDMLAPKKDEDGKVVEPGVAVTAIGNWAFQQKTNVHEITSVSLPASVETIGKEVFLRCDSLKKVTFRNSPALGQMKQKNVEYRQLRELGEGVFRDCKALESISIPTPVRVGIRTIPAYCFMDCSSLTSVTVPASVNTIGELAFAGCMQLETLSAGKTTADEPLPLTNLTSLGNNAFYDCASLQSFSIPSGVTAIPTYCFGRCSSLTELIGMENVTEIGKGAFVNCTSLQSFSVPENVNSIGECAFQGCTSLSDFTFEGNNLTELRAIFGNEGNVPISSLTIPKSVTSISDLDLSGDQALTSISFSDGIRSINGEHFSNTGLEGSLTLPASLQTFSPITGTPNLQYYTIAESNKTFYTNGGLLFKQRGSMGDLLVACPTGFSDKITLDANVTEIGDKACYGCKRIKSLWMSGVNSIGENAFYEASISEFCDLHAADRERGILLKDGAFVKAELGTCTVYDSLYRNAKQSVFGDAQIQELFIMDEVPKLSR